MLLSEASAKSELETIRKKLEYFLETKASYVKFGIDAKNAKDGIHEVYSYKIGHATFISGKSESKDDILYWLDVQDSDQEIQLKLDKSTARDLLDAASKFGALVTMKKLVQFPAKPK